MSTVYRHPVRDASAAAACRRQSPFLNEVVRLNRALDVCQRELTAQREARTRAEDETAEARLEAERHAARAADQRKWPAGRELSPRPGERTPPGDGGGHRWSPSHRRQQQWSVVISRER